MEGRRRRLSRWVGANLGMVLIVAACASDPSPTPGEPAVVAMSLTARNIAFEPEVLTVRAGVGVVLAFDNLDQGVPHGLVLFADAAQNRQLGAARIATGPDHQRIEIPPLLPGRYLFSCVVHPIMTATLQVDPN